MSRSASPRNDHSEPREAAIDRAGVLPSAAWTPVGFILDGDDWAPGDIGALLNGPVGYGYSIDHLRVFAAAPDMYAALTDILACSALVELCTPEELEAAYERLDDALMRGHAAVDKADGQS